MNDIMQRGRELYAYEISGKYDLEEMKDEPMDGIWCSIYDVLKLIKYEIIDPLDDEDYQAAYDYLTEAKSFTSHHQNDAFEF